MGLCMLDAEVGTIVDHSFEWVEDEARMITRDVRRRGIIVKVDGNKNKDSIKAIHVLFDEKEGAKTVRASELVRVYKASHRYAREAYRRVMGAPRFIGSEFKVKRSPRVKVVDSLALPGRSPEGVVKPEFDEENVGGVEVSDTNT